MAKAKLTETVPKGSRRARRDEKKEKAAQEVKRQSHKDMGIEHP